MCTNADAHTKLCSVHGVQDWSTEGLNIPCAAQCIYAGYIIEREGKGKRRRDALEVLRLNSVIIRGGRDRPGKIIFR